MNRTKIEYLDYDLNIITGCSGKGCAVQKHCWARSMARRLRGRYGYPKDNPFKPTFHKDKLDHAFKVKKPSRIGLSFMGDFFDKEVPMEWQQDVLNMVRTVPRHTFIILTKQPQNIPFRYMPENLWLGVTINRKADLWRIGQLLRHQAIVHAISFEPLYEDMGNLNLWHIEWVIIGAQTRPLVMPDYEWIQKLTVQAKRFGIPVFCKNNLAPLIEPKTYQEFPEV